jgi:hypothetical protein
MKKIIFKSFLLLWTVLLACSCNDLLDEKAYDFVSPEQLGDSESAASQLVTGAYNTVITSFIAPGSYLYLTNMDCDYASGASWAFGNVGAGNPQGFWGIDHMWQGSYTLIHRANLGISKISAMSNLSQESKQDALAQLCFLKAWAYFNLVRNYGPVPIFRKSISEGEAMSQPRASVSDVYAHIIELLEQAEGMYSKDDAGFVVGHASNGAAKALLAKVYVTMASGAMSGVPIVVKGGNPNIFEPQPITHIAKTVAGYESFDPAKYYALARDKAWEVINEYTLFDNYMDVWAIGNRNKGEHIWMAQAISGDKDFGNTICQIMWAFSKKTVRWKVTGMVCAITGICFSKNRISVLSMELFIDMRRMVYPMVRLSITIIPVGMQIKWRIRRYMTVRAMLLMVRKSIMKVRGGHWRS